MLNIYHTNCDRSQFNGIKVVSEFISIADDDRWEEYEEQFDLLDSSDPILFDFSRFSGEDLIENLIRAQAISQKPKRVINQSPTYVICSEKITSTGNKTPLNKTHYHF